METILSVKNLSKSFKNYKVLDNISFQVKKGEIFSLLGLNGVGKTTLIKCILNFLKFQGEIFYENNLIKQKTIYKDFGYLPENFSLPFELTPKELLTKLAFAWGVKRNFLQNLFEEFSLPNKKLKTFSRGMLQKTGLLISLLKDPNFLILDEPTLGLDPSWQRKILSLIKILNQKGKTIFFTSHNLFHIEEITTTIAVLHEKKIKFYGKPQELILKHKTKNLEEAFLKEINYA